MNNHHSTDDLVVVFIDVLYDFLHGDGAFAAAYGQAKTATVRSVLPELQELASATVAAANNNIQTVVVTSRYQPNQFKTCPTLCTTDQGRQCMLPLSLNMTTTLTMAKTTNNLLDSNEREAFLNLIKDKRVLLCGVTAAHCVKQAVEALSAAATAATENCGESQASAVVPHYHCRQVIVARNVVGYTGQSDKQMDHWERDYPNVSVVPTWQQVLYPSSHYVYRQILQSKNYQAVGEGDSFFVPNVLSNASMTIAMAGDGDNNDSSAALVDRIIAEVSWEKMYIRGKAVSRDVAIQMVPSPSLSASSSSSSEAAITRSPIYRNPGWESLQSNPMTPLVNQIRLELQNRLGLYLNHVKIQLYKDGSAAIGRHSDKTIDICHGSPIVNVSLGCERTFSLTKKQRQDDDDDEDNVRHFAMTDNSCFILGFHTNRTHWHHVDKAENNKYKKSTTVGRRISMVFRHIATYVQSSDGQLVGQGAKRENAAASSSLSHDAAAVEKANSGGKGEKEQLLDAFARENRETELRWCDLYGRGSNVIK